VNVTGLELPPATARGLTDFVQAAEQHLAGHLKSIVLYGSAAEGRLRPTSDVNLILVLSTFERAGVDALRESLRVAAAAINLNVMFLLEREVAGTAETFAVKFADILRRRKVLFGRDPFEGLSVPRQAEIARLKQVLFNLALRLRSIYAMRSLREEQLAHAIADFAGPFRAAAAALLELQGERPGPPKESLERVAAALDLPHATEVLTHISEARENRVLTSGIAGDTVFHLIELAQRMHKRVEEL
jgi:predicted nucleotidyltransferase